jgi:hypothetical protein
MSLSEVAQVFQLPPFTVVVWVRKTAEFTTIRGQLLAIVAAEPDESIEYEGMVGFNRVAGADQLSKCPEAVVAAMTDVPPKR